MWCACVGAHPFGLRQIKGPAELKQQWSTTSVTIGDPTDPTAAAAPGGDGVAASGKRLPRGLQPSEIKKLQLRTPVKSREEIRREREVVQWTMGAEADAPEHRQSTSITRAPAPSTLARDMPTAGVANTYDG